MKKIALLFRHFVPYESARGSHVAARRILQEVTKTVTSLLFTPAAPFPEKLLLRKTFSGALFDARYSKEYLVFLRAPREARNRGGGEIKRK